MWTIWSNLALARDFLSGGKFKSARFSLAAAKASLSKLEQGGDQFEVETLGCALLFAKRTSHV
jgi:hypothetical protein